MGEETDGGIKSKSESERRAGRDWTQIRRTEKGMNEEGCEQQGMLLKVRVNRSWLRSRRSRLLLG
jgi:hypothetical protein